LEVWRKGMLKIASNALMKSLPSAKKTNLEPLKISKARFLEAP
jgi:hypothetical protein